MSDESNTPDPAATPIEWDHLRERAMEAMKKAYVPYSNFPVGAAALLDTGDIVVGTNVENASYGLTLCAECALVSNIALAGGGKIRAFLCVDSQGNVLMPCGRCRQLLYEHRSTAMLLQTVSGLKTMDEVLPEAFGRRTSKQILPAIRHLKSSSAVAAR